MDQPGKVANPACGQLKRENNIPLSPCVPENLVSRDGFSRPVPRQPAHLHTQAESGAYLRDSSRVEKLFICRSITVLSVVLYSTFTIIDYCSCWSVLEAGRPGSSEVPRNPLTRWDVSSIPANGIFLTKKLKN